jgi:zinc protease
VSAQSLLVEEQHDLPLVHFQVVLPVGTLHDPVGQEGLTRMCARLLRRGTKHRGTTQIEDTIDGLGAELGIDVSAGYMRFSGSTLTRSLPAVLALISEMLREPAFPEAELSQLKRETESALLELTDNDQALASMAFRRLLFTGHPYGRPSVGTRQSLARIDLGSIEAQYRACFDGVRPMLAMAGDVTRAEGERLYAEFFAWPQAQTRDFTTVEPLVQKPGRRLRIVDKPERTQTQIMIGRLGTAPADADHTALIVGNAVFGGTFTSRLMRAVRSERGWSYGASSRLGLDRTREAFNVWTFPQASDAAACAALELQLLEELYDKGITQEELTFAQSYLAKSFAFSTDTADKRLEQAVDLWLYALPPDYFSRYVQRIQHVTRDEVNAAISKRLSPAELTLAAVATDADIGDALRALPGLTEVQVVPFDADATA